jgi:hypothetical protein
MSELLKDSGWDGMHATVEPCDECEQPTIHLSVTEGVPICTLCGYNPIFDALADDIEADDLPPMSADARGHCP